MSDEGETVPTPVGTARVRMRRPSVPRGLVCLGHGAGGGVGAPDLVAVRDALVAGGWAVALVEQPYRVAGRRAPAPAAQLDTAWRASVEAVRPEAPGPLVVGGRSSGARVACRTATDVGAAAVVCLAFPLVPPRRPDVTRLPELLAVGVPCLVVQGDRDPFGAAGDFPAGLQVVEVPGDHSLKRSAAAVGAAVAEWLARQRLA
ncbi:MAG TPA: alpha/beta family hydrolase [Mycobacteriales bacterium]|nr:alpha/beta family hydrolase [Mycobacteriales bacterium]